MNNLKLSIFLVGIFLCNMSFAQVAGISYTLAPSGEYVFWNNKAGLEDGLLVGAKVGLGFGEFFELRGSYMQSLSLKNDFSKFGIAGYDSLPLVQSDVKLTRYGGEVKANFSRGRLLPFILLGTGIQEIQLAELDPRKQIYLTAGAGIKLGIANRFTLTLEGRNTAYRYNTAEHLLTAADKLILGTTGTSFPVEELTNWSAAAALQIYIGGRKPGQMTDLDRAYFDAFSGGTGLNLGLEAVIGKMDFDKNLLYRDTWMAGASAGFDFGPYIGLRGFYWRALQEDSFTKFDDLAMWGGELRMQLNTSGGFTPFLMIGGGKMDVQEGYEGALLVDTDTIGVILDDTSDRAFAMGGAGLTIPLTKNFKIFGSARAILTSASPLDDFTAPEEIQTSWFYSAGVKLNFGNRNKNPENLMQQKISNAVDAKQAENDAKADALKAEYEAKILDLENAVIDAYAEQDLEKAEILKTQKEQAEQVVEELENRDDPTAGKPLFDNTPATASTTPNNPLGLDNISIVPTNSRITMSPAEFENLIEEILEGVEGQSYNPYMQAGYPNYATPQASGYAPNPAMNNPIMQRLDAIEKRLGGVDNQSVTTPNAAPAAKAERTESETKMLSMLIKMEQQLKENAAAMDKVNARLIELESDSRGKSKKKKDEEVENVEPMQILKRKSRKERREERKKEKENN